MRKKKVIAISIDYYCFESYWCFVWSLERKRNNLKLFLKIDYQKKTTFKFSEKLGYLLSSIDVKISTQILWSFRPPAFRSLWNFLVFIENFMTSLVCKQTHLHDSACVLVLSKKISDFHISHEALPNMISILKVRKQ